MNPQSRIASLYRLRWPLLVLYALCALGVASWLSGYVGVVVAWYQSEPWHYRSHYVWPYQPTLWSERPVLFAMGWDAWLPLGTTPDVARAVNAASTLALAGFTPLAWWFVWARSKRRLELWGQLELWVITMAAGLGVALWNVMNLSFGWSSKHSPPLWPLCLTFWIDYALFWGWGLMLWMLFTWPRWLDEDAPRLCDACGYDLRGTAEAAACPECGAAAPLPASSRPGEGARVFEGG